MYSNTHAKSNLECVRDHGRRVRVYTYGKNSATCGFGDQGIVHVIDLKVYTHGLSFASSLYENHTDCYID
jgi:hypothetical protein